MTREELERAVAKAAFEHGLLAADYPAAARAMIRLVVEACITVTSIQDWDGHVADKLRTTFLPPEAKACEHEWVRPVGNVGSVCRRCGTLGPMTD